MNSLTQTDTEQTRADNGRTVLDVREVSHGYAAKRGGPVSYVLEDVSLTAQAKEFISIVGPSGCGKSTLLRLISGLARPSRGEIIVQGAPITPGRRDVGFIFQRDALLPWRTAGQNVQLALKFRRMRPADARRRALDWLDRFGLAGMADRYPHQLSGGQRKRVAIAATLVYEPDLLLMDEPFSALDVQTRDLIETDVLDAWEQSDRQTVAFVTHDLEEAIAMSDRVVVMSASPGRIKSEYRIDLPRPRDIMDIRGTDAFRGYYERIWQDLRVEVQRRGRLGDAEPGPGAGSASSTDPAADLRAAP
jgi:NitT/TauT family transport system ATP-binding protein